MTDDTDRSPESDAGIDIDRGDNLGFFGENPDTDHPTDAGHWINIYQELIAFHEGVVRRNGNTRRPSTRTAGARPSLDAMEMNSQLDRYRRRLDFWYDRHWQLRGLAIDGQSMVVGHREHKVHLTRREFQLLSFLLAHPNQIFGASVLAQRAWTDSQLSNDQVRIYVARIRGRLAGLDLPCRLVSHPRRGYSFVCDEPLSREREN